MAQQLQPNITSTIINPHASLTVIGVAAGQRGPSPVVTGVPNPTVDMVAPLVGSGRDAPANSGTGGESKL